MKKIISKRKILNLLLLSCFVFGFTFLMHVNVSAATVPTGLKQTAGDDGWVTVAWNSQLNSNVDYYYCISENSTFNSACVEEIYSYDCTESIYNLQAGKTYYVWIGAAEDESTIQWSSPIPVVTAPESVEITSGKFTAASETSVSLSWNAVAGATGYTVNYYPDGASSNTAKSVNVSTNSATLKGLAKNTTYEISVSSYRSVGSYVATAYAYSFTTDFFTLPSKVTGVNCDYFNTSVKKGSATFSWDKKAVVDGYQYEIYKYNGKKKLCSGEVSSFNYDYASVNSSKLKARQVYKIRVRAFANLSNGKKAYASWSSYEYFSRCADTDVKLKKSSGKIKASWSKVTGATGYMVYMSTKSNGGYKKVGTTKTTSLKINKTIKNGSTYYVRIVPYYKKGSTTYLASVNSKYFYSACVYKTKYGWYTYTY